MCDDGCRVVRVLGVMMEEEVVGCGVSCGKCVIV